MPTTVIATLLVLLAAIGSAAAQEDPQRLYMRGAAAYGDARYAEAAALFEQAYAIRPDAPLLYNLGLALEQAGEIARAIDAYERFLAAVPDAVERTEVERSLATLRRQRELELQLERRAEEPEPTRLATTLEPETAPSAASIDPVPWIVVVTGVLTSGGGAIAGVVAQGTYDEARVEPEHRRAAALEGNANDLGLAATVMFVAGAALAGAGTIWGIVSVSGGSGEPSAELRAGPAGVSVSGVF